MQIGYATTFQNPGRLRTDREVWNDEVHFSDLAVSLGFDSIWSTEHHFTDYEMIPNPLQFLSFMAGRSDTIRLGTMVIVLPWHDPIRVAEEISVLDNLTGGRMILGIGRGIAPIEFDGFGLDMNQSRQRFNESARLVLDALENGYIESNKGLFNIPRRDIRPEPIYSFRNRTFGAGGSSSSMPIMADLGAGLLIVPTKKWSEVLEDVHAFRDAWGKAQPGRAAPQPLLDQFIFVDEDAGRAKDMAHRYIGTYFRQVLKHYDFGGGHLKETKGYEAYNDFTSNVEKNSDGVVEEFVSYQSWGTPEQVIEKLRYGRDLLDASTLLAHFNYGAMPKGLTEQSMRLFAEKVMPEVKTWVADPYGERTALPSAVKVDSLAA
jgi:alkanesulfonate monooxygenase SsuD/methylene tetrahydromethanopterin reductase-like flavin-dependent oxidoreductase (luciferase family)